MMQRGKDCKPGDTVRFLHEKGGGKVTKVTKEFVYVDIGDGFEIPMLFQDVIIMEKAATDSSVVETETVEQVVAEKKFIRKAEVTKGVYVAFVPVNQNVLLTGDIRIYLINYSKIGIIYTLFLSGDQMQHPSYSGNIEPASAILIDTVERQQLSRFYRGVFQCLFTGQISGGVPAPFSSTIEIREGRFLKEDMYLMNPVIEMMCITSLLLRIDELSLIHFNLSKGFERKDHLEGHSRVIEDYGFIGKFKTAPGEAEVDLHIHKLVNDPDTLSDADKLKLQIDYCKNCIESAIEHSYKKVVFIHGVGVGILKMELHKILKTYENIQFRDAPIAKYGIGATEVLVFNK